MREVYGRGGSYCVPLLMQMAAKVVRADGSTENDFKAPIQVAQK